MTDKKPPRWGGLTYDAAITKLVNGIDTAADELDGVPVLDLALLRLIGEAAAQIKEICDRVAAEI